MMYFSLFGVALLVGIAYAQVCQPTEVIFLLDQSENARRAATTNFNTDFNLLQNSIQRFINNPRIRNLPDTNIRIGIYGYSGGSAQSVYVPEGSSPRQVDSLVRNIGTGPRGGSRTYRGLEMVRNRPQLANNMVIIVSSQGQDINNQYGQQALTEYNRVVNLGWNVKTIAVQGDNPLQLTELTRLNGGFSPVILDDNQVGSRRSYSLLPNELDRVINLELCANQAVITTPRPPNPVTVRAPNGICDDCISSGGFTLRTDPLFCDRFYMCIAGIEPISQMCPVGTFFNGERCDFKDRVACPTKRCDASTEGTRYESGRCCNQYYLCRGGSLVTTNCPLNQVFDRTTSSCTSAVSTNAVCQGENKFICDVNPAGPVVNVNCSAFAADPTGDPCVFFHNGYRQTVAQGTVWSQQNCTQIIRSGVCPAGDDLSARFLDFTDPPATTCSSVFRTTFDAGSLTPISERSGTQLDAFSTLQQARTINNGVQFDNTMSNPFLYYYYFSNLEFPVDTAFRLRFRLDNFVQNVEYDLLSNNYCDLCPDTITISVRATNAGTRVVTAKFQQNAGDNSDVVTTSAAVTGVNQNDMLEALVVYGDTSVYGQVSIVNQGNPDSTPLRTVPMAEVGKTQGAKIATNRCGLQLGNGPDQSFQGLIDDFSIYEHCVDIRSILR